MNLALNSFDRTSALRSGAILGALGVAAGAFGAHALEHRLAPGDLSIFATAAHYQMLHALALCTCAALVERHPRVRVAAACFFWGVLLFSGSLYLLLGTGARWLGAVTPLGGTLLLVGWSVLAVASSGPRSTPAADERS